MADSKSCLQCDAPLAGLYCAKCGQSAAVGPLRVREILADVFGSILDLQLPILRTTKGLLLAPGRTAAEWVDGKRSNYTNPIKYCVIIGVLFTLMIRMRFADQAAVQTDANSATYTLSSLAQEYIAFLVMVLAVPFAPIAGLLSRVLKVERSATDWYALFLYCLGISMLLQMLIGFFSRTAAGIAGVLPIVFLLWGSWQFARPPGRAFAVALLGIGAWLGIFAGLQSALS